MSGLSGDNTATTSYSASSSGRIAHGAAVVITERLAELPDLALPSSLYKEAGRAPATSEVLAYLQALLQKDPAAFLARYGSVLQSQELNHFEALRSADFEVNHWLGFYATQRMAAADQAANPRRLPARVKNRRLAAMRRLAAQGEYFSDEAMRHRAPLLYHQQIGQFSEEQEQPQQQQAAAAAVAELQRQRRQGHAEGEQEREGPETAAGPSGGGLGGSCLAAALRQALQTRDDASPPPGRATAAAAAGPLGSRAEGMHARRGEEGEMDVQMEGAPGPSAAGQGGAGAAGRGSGGGNLPGRERPAGRSDLLFSEFLMRQDDEAQLVMRRMQEQQEEDEQMSEHDSDDDEEEDEEEEQDDEGLEEDGGDGGASHCAGAGRLRRGGGRPSGSERAQMRRDFVLEMQSRFLLGQDRQYGVDYGAIDGDASLDGDWLEEESRDAEEKYFDED